MVAAVVSHSVVDDSIQASTLHGLSAVAFSCCERRVRAPFQRARHGRGVTSPESHDLHERPVRGTAHTCNVARRGHEHGERAPRAGRAGFSKRKKNRICAPGWRRARPVLSTYRLPRPMPRTAGLARPARPGTTGHGQRDGKGSGRPTAPPPSRYTHRAVHACTARAGRDPTWAREGVGPRGRPRWTGAQRRRGDGWTGSFPAAGWMDGRTDGQMGGWMDKHGAHRRVVRWARVGRVPVPCRFWLGAHTHPHHHHHVTVPFHSGGGSSSQATPPRSHPSDLCSRVA